MSKLTHGRRQALRLRFWRPYPELAQSQARLLRPVFPIRRHSVLAEILPLGWALFLVNIRAEAKSGWATSVNKETNTCAVCWFWRQRPIYAGSTKEPGLSPTGAGCF